MGTGIHQFCLGHHTSNAWKVLKARIYQHQFIAGGSGTTTLADVAYLTAPDGVYLLETAGTAQSAHELLRVVPDTFLGRDHPTA